METNVILIAKTPTFIICYYLLINMELNIWTPIRSLVFVCSGIGFALIRTSIGNVINRNWFLRITSLPSDWFFCLVCLFIYLLSFGGCLYFMNRFSIDCDSDRRPWIKPSLILYPIGRIGVPPKWYHQNDKWKPLKCVWIDRNLYLVRGAFVYHLQSAEFLMLMN